MTVLIILHANPESALTHVLLQMFVLLMQIAKYLDIMQFVHALMATLVPLKYLAHYLQDQNAQLIQNAPIILHASKKNAKTLALPQHVVLMLNAE